MKLILGSLIIFSILVLFLFALFPREVSVSRVVLIHQSLGPVQRKIADLREWKSWNQLLVNAGSANRLMQADSTGAGYLRIQGGTVRITSVTSKTVSTLWQHGNKVFTGDFHFTEKEGQTVVAWTLHFRVKWYPWEKLASMFYEKSLGPQMEQSLLNLQRQLEKPAV